MLGIYDSGLGGITVLKELSSLHPNTEIVYFGDTANCPLGEKSDEEIVDAVKSGMEFLFSKGCNLVILACNTATAIAIREIQNNWLPQHYPDKKVLGIIKPTTEMLLDDKIPKDSLVAVFATPATIASDFYEIELNETGYNNTIQIPLSGLASSIENGDLGNAQQIISGVISRYKNYLTDLQVAILACTHYPIVKDIFETELQKINPEVVVLDQAPATAQKLIEYTRKHPEYSLKTGNLSIYTSSDQIDFENKIRDIFGIHTKVLNSK